MEEDGEDHTPFWVQSTTKLRRSDRLRRSVAAVFFSSGLVVFLLVVAAVFFLAFVVASTISFSATIFRPNSVKKSWDSLNIALVLVAVVFGILSRNRNEERSSSFDEFQSSPIKGNESQKSNPSTPQKWFDYSANNEEKSSLYEYQIQDSHQPKFDQKISNLRRSCSSYPDLREFPSSSSTNWSYGDYQMRFFDDFHVDSSPGQLRRYRSLGRVDYPTSPPQIKTLVVDTLVNKTCPEIKSFPAELSPPEDDAIAEKVVYESVAVREEKSSRRFYKDLEITNWVSAAAPAAEESQPPELQESQKRSRERAARRKERSSRRQVYENVGPTNPIATPPPPSQQQMMIGESERRRGGATAANSKKVFLNSLYKKKKRQLKSVENVESLLRGAPPPRSYQIPPAPPLVFHTLFSFSSKKPKGKKTVTVSLEPLPRSPPPVSPPHEAARETEPTSHAPPPPTYSPPKPVKITNFDGAEEAQNSGGESPFRRIPPPPPPPPFSKTPAWKFVVQGDYVRVNSSRSGSPELDETDSDITPSAADGGGAAAALFCPSPDVNSKAESFITKFRANLKLEKIHSMKKRNVGPSSLGPGLGPNQI
ncbi:hypothetical protein SASPL_106915 [Salvia splendens]|uniref:Uncharacterized protein n=1 Tax=Salvia splendens TaxID=180675 RepID=A0A8X9A601_SALSN|nr:uncharacterized protein LOC121795326 [Salvia splendens]KAG6428876.1 hypothetical protein SASPL_106915 [Salvia splendens]